MRLQFAISSIVLWQPSHHPVIASIRHTETQGDGTGDCAAPAGSGIGYGVGMRGFSNVNATLTLRGYADPDPLRSS
jgi:hypothetical protein